MQMDYLASMDSKRANLYCVYTVLTFETPNRAMMKINGYMNYI